MKKRFILFSSAKKLSFFVHFLSFLISVALLCNFKNPSNDQKNANFRLNVKSLNHFYFKKQIKTIFIKNLNFMDFTFQVLNNTRGIFKTIIENNALSDLNLIPEGFNNNIIWNIGHVIVSEQLLAYRLSGLDSSLSDEMINKYRKDSKPNGMVSMDEVNEIKALLSTTLEKTKEDYYNDVFENYNAYTVSTTGNTLNNIDEALEFVAIHEGLHYGYVLALLKAIKN